jgi:hypothetical protein
MEGDGLEFKVVSLGLKLVEEVEAVEGVEEFKVESLGV